MAAPTKQRRARVWRLLGCAILIAGGAPGLGLGAPRIPGQAGPGAAYTPVPVEELARRRGAAMRLLPDGLLVLHARSGAKAEDQPGFQQDYLLNIPHKWPPI